MARIFHSFCIAAVVAAASACTTMEPNGTIRSSTVAVGSSIVRSIQDSGSYGNGARTVTLTRMPNRDWKGQTVGVWQPNAGPTLLLRPDDGAFVAFVNGEQPVVSFEPAWGWPWPLKVGKSWTTNLMMTMHASNQRVPVESRGVVEAYEDVTIPAGTFKAFRIRTSDNLGNEEVHWVNPDLTVFLKQKLTRTARHAAGPGVRETQLLSQSIRHQ